MTETDFICGLMRYNTDALGFIPRPTIEHRFIPRGHYLIQRNRFGKPIGYLLHGPVHPNGNLFIHQTCIDLARRNKHFGHQLTQTLLARAASHHAKLIRLRCATDLDAIAFWTALGFDPKETTQGGHRRQRHVTRLELILPSVHVFQPRKVGLRLASSEPTPEGHSASQSSKNRGTVKLAGSGDRAETASGGSWSVSGNARVPRPAQTTVRGFRAHF